jgi:predicted RNA-binding Zn-ribbon protein involved in translation (DUF1610 family)
MGDMLEKNVTCIGHEFTVEISESDEKVYYDHTEMSSRKPGSGTHVFEVEENGEQVRYVIVMTYQKTRYAFKDRPYRVERRQEPSLVRFLFEEELEAKETREETAALVANLFSRKISSFGFAIIRNGEVVYNDGVPMSEIVKDIKKKKIKVGIDESEGFGVCTTCSLKVEIPNSHYCPNCGEALKHGPIVGAFSWKRGNPNRPNIQPGKENRLPACIICARNLGRKDLLAWCPFCGCAAHRTEMLMWLRSNKTCRRCNQKLDEESLSEYLSPA